MLTALYMFLPALAHLLNQPRHYLPVLIPHVQYPVDIRNDKNTRYLLRAFPHLSTYLLKLSFRVHTLSAVLQFTTVQ